MYNQNWQEDVKIMCRERVLFHRPLQLGALYSKIGKSKVNPVVIQWFIEECLEYSENDVYEKLDTTVFKKYGFKVFLDKQYDGAVYYALNAAYPRKYTLWKLKQLPLGAWENKLVARNSLKEWIEKEMKWEDADICQKFTLANIKKAGKYGRRMFKLIEIAYECDPLKALQDLYPQKFKRGKCDKIELK